MRFVRPKIIGTLKVQKMMAGNWPVMNDIKNAPNKIIVLAVFTFLFRIDSTSQNMNAEDLLEIIDKKMIASEYNGLLTLETLSPVSVKDYNKFQQYVRDSTAKETIYFGIEEDEMSLDYLNVDKKTMVHPSERELNRSMFNLREKVKDLYTKYIHVAQLQFMKIPQRYYSVISNEYSYDDRTLYYESDPNKSYSYSDTSLSSSAYSIFHNHWRLLEFSNRKHDIPYVLAQTLPIFFQNQAPYDLTMDQYNAFLHWKRKNIQSSLKENKFDADIDLVPIFQVDTFQYLIQGPELVDQWGIEREEYEQFLKSTCDSVVRETLYYELSEFRKAERFLNYQDEYFCEEHLEFVEFDPTTKVENRKLFSLNYKSKIRNRKKEVEEIVSKTRSENKESLKFCYLTIDIEESLSNSKSFEEKNWRNYPWFEIDTNYAEIFPIQEIDSTERFMELLNYNQALAFYHWKFPISKSSENTNWKNYIYPTKEEFINMQSGKSSLINNKSFEYISNSLNYRIRFTN
ncbi:MAG: hypothetical protein COA32_10305 [Fluviicola sp.]|nr:MAG: hypothetical protein COA32_10305 [Fluviicola sp.]